MKKYDCTGIDEPYRNKEWCPDGSNPGCRNKKENIPRVHTFWPVKKQFQKDIVKDIPYAKEYEKSCEAALQSIIRKRYRYPEYD